MAPDPDGRPPTAERGNHPNGHIGLGLFCILIGAAAGWRSLGYGIGRATEMGPGFFPLSVSLLLVAFGISILALRGRDVAPSMLDLERTEPGSMHVMDALLHLARVLGSVLGGILLFGLLVRPAGLLVSSFALVAVSSLGHPSPRPLAILILAAGVSAATVIIFVVLLGLNLPVWPGALQ